MDEVMRNSVDTEPRYVISVVAKILGVQTHTLRYYEKIGVVRPHRSQGNIRLYCERDVAQLRRVKTLMEELGVNLAGVDIILRMMQQMSELQQRIEEMESELEKLK